MKHQVGQCLFLFNCLLISLSAFSQNPDTIDSLKGLLQTTPKDSNYVDILNEMSYQSIFTDLKKSRQYAKEATQLAVSINYKKGEARGLLNEGNAIQDQGLYSLALSNYIKALDIAKKINYSRVEATCYNELGNVYRFLKDYARSLTYHKKALSIRQKLKDQKGISASIANIGMIYKAQRKDSLALKYLLKALSIDQSRQDKQDISISYFYIGLFYFDLQESSRALPFFEKALDFALETKFESFYNQIYNYLAEIYFIRNDLKAAKNYALKAVEAGIKTSTTAHLREAYRILYRIEKQNLNFETALAYLEKHKLWQDSLFSEAKNREISNLQFNYELEKKQKEIAILNQSKKLEESESAKRGLVILIFAICFLFLSIFSFVLYRSKLRLGKINEILNLQNQKIIEQKKLVENQNEEIATQAEELKEVNEEILEINESLEQKIQIRTEQLLLQNQQISDYAFLNTHKLRGPLARAMGLVYLLKNNLSSENYEQILVHLHASLDEIDKIIREINATLDR